MEKVFYIHHFNREFPVHNSPCCLKNQPDCWENEPYMTFAYRHIDDVHIEYGFALCNKNDSYNKAIGREIALKHLNEKTKNRYRVLNLHYLLSQLGTEIRDRYVTFLKAIPKFLTLNDLTRQCINNLVRDDVFNNDYNYTTTIQYSAHNNDTSVYGNQNVSPDYEKIHFIHVFDKNSIPAVTKNKYSGVKGQKDYTIGYQFIDENTVKIAVAVCNPKEHYNKKIGREIVTKKLDGTDVGYKPYILNFQELIQEHPLFEDYEWCLGIKPGVKIPVGYLWQNYITTLVKSFVYHNVREIGRTIYD